MAVWILPVSLCSKAGWILSSKESLELPVKTKGIIFKFYSELVQGSWRIRQLRKLPLVSWKVRTLIVKNQPIKIYIKKLLKFLNQRDLKTLCFQCNLHTWNINLSDKTLWTTDWLCRVFLLLAVVPQVSRISVFCMGCTK